MQYGSRCEFTVRIDDFEQPRKEFLESLVTLTTYQEELVNFLKEKAKTIKWR